MELKQIEKISKALGDTNRLRILVNMAASGGLIQCAKIINDTELAQPSVSHHIKTLVEAGLIEPAKEGRCYSYLLNKQLLKEFINQLNDISE
ncbi:MAG: metalloregulator ArsR/SmtB family transcription factor [Ferruginibacter sp.]